MNYSWIYGALMLALLGWFMWGVGDDLGTLAPLTPFERCQQAYSESDVFNKHYDDVSVCNVFGNNLELMK